MNLNDEQEFSDQMLVAMASADIAPGLMWVWIKAGLIPTKDNQKLMTKHDRRAIKAAWREWDEKQIDLKPYIQGARQRLGLEVLPK